METTRKVSIKRSAILEFIRSTKEHPSAERVYAALKTEYPDLSLATVYRNLGVLREEGLISSVGKVAGQERFDGNTIPHTHFICDFCGRMIDVDVEMPVIDGKHFAALENSTGISISSCNLSFSGLCRECREKREKKGKTYHA